LEKPRHDRANASKRHQKMTSTALTLEIVVVLCLLAGTVFLFVSEVVRIDFAAILVMLTLGFLSQIPGLTNLADPNTLLTGLLQTPSSPSLPLCSSVQAWPKHD